jgi:hypothetical protein
MTEQPGGFVGSILTRRFRCLQSIEPRHGYGRAAAIQAMPTWNAAFKPAGVSALLRCLRSVSE